MGFNALVLFLVLFIDYVCMFTPIALTTVLSFLLPCSFSLLDWECGDPRSRQMYIYVRLFGSVLWTLYNQPSNTLVNLKAYSSVQSGPCFCNKIKSPNSASDIGSGILTAAPFIITRSEFLFSQIHP